MTVTDYPGVTNRIKTVVTDSVVLVIFMIVITFSFSAFEGVPQNARIIAFLLIFVLIDPLFTSLNGGTVSHRMFGIRVKRDNNPKKNIVVPLVLLRFIVKTGHGWISLLTFSGNKKRKAIRGYLTGSVALIHQKEVPRKSYD